MNDIVVAKALIGSLRTGKSTNMGIMMGSMAGKVRFWASLASLQAEPTAASRAPCMTMAKRRKAKNQGIARRGTKPIPPIWPITNRPPRM